MKESIKLLGRRLRVYSSFLGLALTIQMTLLSIALFFHFQLGHTISVMEEWLQRNHWALVGFSKILSLGIILRYQGIPIDFRWSGLTHLRNDILGGLYLWPLLFFWGGAHVLNTHQWQWDLALGSYLGCLVYLGTDFWLWRVYFSVLDQEKKSPIGPIGDWKILIFPVLAMMVGPLFFPFRPLWNFTLVLHLFVLGLSTVGTKGGWGYLLFVAAPMSALWGADYWLVDSPGFMSWATPLTGVQIAALWAPYVFFLLFEINRSGKKLGLASHIDCKEGPSYH